MDVAKAIRKTVLPKSGETSSHKSSVSRLQATQNHVCTMRSGQDSSANGSSSSKGRPAKPDLCPKPQALIDQVRQERLAQKFKTEGADGMAEGSIDYEVADDSGDEGEAVVEMRIKGVNLKLEDSTTEEKASDEIEGSSAVKSTGISSDVTITSSPSSQTSSCDAVAKANTDHTKETSKSVSNDSTNHEKDTKSNGHRKSHQSHSPTSPSTSDFNSNKPLRLNMRAVSRHRSESDCPKESSSKSRHLLNKQSSDISFDRGLHLKGTLKKLTSSLSSHAKEGVSEDIAESEDVDDDDICKEGESFRTRVARFAREKFHRALSLGSPQQSPQLTTGTLAPPLEEEPEDDAGDSSSDDEKGGTIKFKPKLRHVSVKKPLSFDDDSEPEYHQLFEYVFVVGLKEKTSGSQKGKLTTELTYNFPPASDSAKKDLALQSIPQFCFPDVDQWKPVKEFKSESFSFVLTDMEGSRRYGYCRRLLPQGTGKRLPEVYCIVSPLGCFSLYEKILDHVEERRSMATAVSVFTFLKAIVANPFPRPGRSVQVPVISARGTGMETVVFERPMDSRLEHVDFSLLFNTLSQRKVIQVFSSLLMERRVILCAQSLSLLSGCAHALLALLYPFEWQHVFIPVLPGSLIDFVCSPLPYIIGINPSCIKQIETMETMEEALIVDLEKKKFVRKIGDETSILPTKLFQYLEHSLSSAVVTGEYSKKSSDAASRSRADEIVVNTFMTFFAYLYGDYKSFMSVTNPSRGDKEFRRKDFVKKFSSKSTKRFLEAFQMTQMFENFIEQRENPSKAATVSESLFEKKIPDLNLGCQEIEIFSSKSRFDRWRIKKGFVKNS